MTFNSWSLKSTLTVSEHIGLRPTILIWSTNLKHFLLSIGSGELEFDEFLTLTARFLVEEDAEAMQEELREAFRMYDKEGNGYIPTSALREILRALDDKLTEDELDEMIAEIDTDGSGTVDFDGNLTWCDKPG